MLYCSAMTLEIKAKRVLQFYPLMLCQYSECLLCFIILSSSKLNVDIMIGRVLSTEY